MKGHTVNRETWDIINDDDVMDAIAEAMEDIANGDVFPLEDDNES